MKIRSVVALEIASSSVKIAQASFPKGKKVLRLIGIEISGKDDAGIGREIADAFKRHGIDNRDVMLNIPRTVVMTRSLRLPAVDDGEIKKMVGIEAMKQMPHFSETVSIGYRIIEKTPEGYSDVLAAAVQESALDRYMKILKAAGLSPSRIAFSSESVMALYTLNGKTAPIADTAPVILINIDNDYADIDVIEGSMLTVTRAFAPAGTGSSLARETADEIRKSIAMSHKSGGLSPGKIVLCGAHAITGELSGLLSEEFAGMPEMLDLQPPDWSIQIENADPEHDSFAPVCGLALNAEMVEADLLPDAIIAELDRKALRREAIKSAVIVVSAALLFTAAEAKRFVEASVYMSHMDAELKTLEPAVKKAEDLEDRTKTIRAYAPGGPFAIEVLSELYALTPAGVIYSTLDYEKAKYITLKGSAPSLDDVVKLVRALEGSKYFKSARIRYTSRRQRDSVWFTDFEMGCTARGGADR